MAELELVPLSGHGSGAGVPSSLPESLRVGTWPSNRAIGVLLLNRPQKLNAWSAEMWAGFQPAVEALAAEPGVRVLVLLARGPAFTAGIDLQFLGGMVSRCAAAPSAAERRDAALHSINALQRAYSALEACKHPVVVAVQGQSSLSLTPVVARVPLVDPSSQRRQRLALPAAQAAALARG